MKLTAGRHRGAFPAIWQGVSDFVWWDSEIAGFGYQAAGERRRAAWMLPISASAGNRDA